MNMADSDLDTVSSLKAVKRPTDPADPTSQETIGGPAGPIAALPGLEASHWRHTYRLLFKIDNSFTGGNRGFDL